MRNHPPSLNSMCLTVTCLLLGTTLAVARLTANRKPALLAQSLDTISHQVVGFKATDNPPLEQSVVRQLRPSSYLSRTYRKPNLSLDLLIAYYAQQRAGESMHSPKHCLPGAGWEISDFGSVDIPVNGRKFKVNRDSISREGARMVVLYWYQSKGRIIASEYLGKILLARDALLQNSTSAAIVRLAVPDKPGASEEASAFASTLIPEVWRCLGSTPAEISTVRTYPNAKLPPAEISGVALADSLHKVVN
jgi:EpsI family protein